MHIRFFVTSMLALFLYKAVHVPIVEAREIRMAVSGEMAPFFFRESDSWQGASIEIAQIVLETLGHTIILVNDVPMNRLERRMADGSIDLHPNWTPTKTREKVAIFTSVAHVIEEHAFITMKDHSIPYDGTSGSLAGVRIAAMQGWTHGPDFDNDMSINKIFMDSVPAQVRVLARGRVQAAVQNPQTFFASASLHGYDPEDFSVLEPATVKMPVYMGISRAMDKPVEFRDSLDTAIRNLLDSAVYHDVLKKYNLE